MHINNDILFQQTKNRAITLSFCFMNKLRKYYQEKKIKNTLQITVSIINIVIILMFHSTTLLFLFYKKIFKIIILNFNFVVQKEYFFYLNMFNIFLLLVISH